MQDQKGCKKNIRAEEEQIVVAWTKHEEDTGERPTEVENVFLTSARVCKPNVCIISSNTPACFSVLLLDTNPRPGGRVPLRETTCRDCDF